MVNETIETPVVIGAGGHFCPVARFMRGGSDTATPVVAKEVEFPLAGRLTHIASGVPELFVCRDLEGYAWCVRKGDYLNVGIGRRGSQDFNDHVNRFAAFLEDSGALTDASNLKWHGHAYLASGTGARPVIGDGVLLVGDAAGLAYPESGGGIRRRLSRDAWPRKRSSRQAADQVLAALQPYADEVRRLYPRSPRTPAPLRSAVAAAGRWLLSSSAFTRHVVLNRWFLRRAVA